MGPFAWIILLGVSAALATAVQYTFFRHDRKPTDYDWVYIAGGALLGASQPRCGMGPPGTSAPWWTGSTWCQHCSARSSWVSWWR
jgi:hypothetical protein